MFKAAEGGEGLVPVKAHHRVFAEYETADASKATVFRQTKDTPDGLIRKGEWHVDIKDVAF